MSYFKSDIEPIDKIQHSQRHDSQSPFHAMFKDEMVWMEFVQDARYDFMINILFLV